MMSSHKKFVSFGNIKVYIVKGNISEQQVDVIVNSANTDLDLSKGKASAALLQAAGTEVQTDCQTNYPHGISHGQVAVTGPGNLNCSHIFHGALPKYTGPAEEQVLEGLVQACLEEAENLGLHSIALPAFGTGLLAYPAPTSATVTFNVIKDFATNNPGCTLNTVYIVIYSQDAGSFKAFTQEARKHGSPQVVRHPSRQGLHSPNSVSIGKITVAVETGKLPNFKADVIVCSGPKDLQLQNGGLAQAILEAAGTEIQEDCDNGYSEGIDYGDVAVTRGHNLQCKRVYFGALPSWGTSNPDPLQALKDFTDKCLQEANKNRSRSISFPTLGTGSLKYPADQTAKTMVDCIRAFESSHPNTKLHHMTIVVYDGSPDCSNVQAAFFRELGHPSSSGSTRDQAITKKAVTTQTYNNIKVRVIVDEMTTIKVDVIVNNTSPNLQLAKSNGLAKSLVNAGGSALQTELDHNYPNGISPGGMAITSGGSLKCKQIYHGSLTSWYSKKTGGKKPEDVMEAFVTDCLKKAEGGSHTSIAFPALGTGYLKFPADVCAKHMLHAVHSFSSQAKHLKEVVVVLYHGSDLQTIENAFIEELQHVSSTGSGAEAVTAPTDAPKKKSQHKVPPTPGTPAYYKWMCIRTPYPPKYWSYFKSTRSLRDWTLSRSYKPFELTDPDVATVKTITSAFLNTVGGNYVVQTIKRVENVDLYIKYSDECQRLFRKYNNITKIENMHGSRGKLKTMTLLDKSMTEHLSTEINEYYFFHGTKYNLVENIKIQGLDSRLAAHGRLGAGVYGAEVASKSNGYTGAADSNGFYYMFLIRMCLGDVHLTQRGGGYRRPPCKTCGNDVCTDHPDLYDSVVADGGAFSHREFVVYDKNQSYPEYLIVFK